MAVPGGLAAVAAALVLAVERLEIVGGSMRPTLEPGDHVLVLRFVRPRVGDLVALRDPRAEARVLVKRVAAIDSGGIIVLGDNSVSSTDSGHFGPVARHLIRGRVVYRYAPDPRRGWIGGSGRLP